MINDSVAVKNVIFINICIWSGIIIVARINIFFLLQQSLCLYHFLTHGFTIYGEVLLLMFFFQNSSREIRKTIRIIFSINEYLDQFRQLAWGVNETLKCLIEFRIRVLQILINRSSIILRIITYGKTSLRLFKSVHYGRF